jgi:hypothetical protein
MKKIKLTEEEIQTINKAQSDNNIIRVELGRIAITRIELDVNENNLKTALVNLRNSETELNKTLTAKYGTGTIDLASGEITIKTAATASTEPAPKELQKIDEADESN